MGSWLRYVIATIARKLGGGSQKADSIATSEMVKQPLLLDIPACRSLRLYVSATDKQRELIELAYVRHCLAVPLLPFSPVEAWFRQVLLAAGEKELAEDVSFLVKAEPCLEGKLFSNPGIVNELITLIRTVEDKRENRQEAHFFLMLGEVRRNLKKISAATLTSSEQLSFSRLKIALEDERVFQNLEPWLRLTESIIKREWADS